MWQIAFEINRMIKTIDRMRESQKKEYYYLQKNNRLLHFNSTKSMAVYLGVVESEVMMAIKKKKKIQGYEVNVVFHRH